MKYVGSKASIIAGIKPVIESYLGSDSWYVEPFVGGANSIVKISCSKRVGADNNRYVVALLVALRDGWEPEYLSRESYNDIRSNPDRYDDHLVGWAGICGSYSGKWFGGYAGKVDTAGGVRDYMAEAISNCLRQSGLLNGIEFYHRDYRDTVAPPGSVIYCDPPYANTLKYASDFNSLEFWDWCNQMSADHWVLVSEYSAPPGWDCIWERPIGSSLSANGKVGGRKRSVERLFTKDVSIDALPGALDVNSRQQNGGLIS